MTIYKNQQEFYKQLKQNLEDLYQKWQFDLQNMRNLNQANLFLQEHEERYIHFHDFFKNKFDALRKTVENERDESKRVLELYHQEVSAHGIEAVSKNAEIVRQMIESSVKLRIVREKCEKEDKWLSALREKFYIKSSEALQQFRVVFNNIQRQQDVQLQGLSARSIRRFQLFTADESCFDDKCSICMEDIDVGRRMRRLTCDGKHYFCKECIEGWFAEHNTCPLCRHKFD